MKSIGLSLVLAALSLSACDDLPGDTHTHATLIGDPHRTSVNPLGASGAYVCGVSPSKDDPGHRNELLRASHNAETIPAGVDWVKQSTTADLNNDGFVTLDEVLALRNSGMSDDEMISRLRATGYRFSLTRYQEQFLRDRGMGKWVVRAIE
jgi:hypothetical protein